MIKADIKGINQSGDPVHWIWLIDAKSDDNQIGRGIKISLGRYLKSKITIYKTQECYL